MSGPGEIRYQPFYCEENVWHACADERFAGRAPKAVFLSSSASAIVMWHQRAAPRDDAPVLWDYHVVTLVERPWEIWDPDTMLGAPVSAIAYLRRSFPYAGLGYEGAPERPRLRVPARMMPRFRVVEGAEFRENFASDRAHMRTRAGRYKRPPPPWPAIGGEGRASNLDRFRDVDAPFFGQTLSFDELWRRVADSAG